MTTRNWPFSQEEEGKNRDHSFSPPSAEMTEVLKHEIINHLCLSG